MAIKKYKPVTPGQRNKAISSFEEITAKKPYKKLLVPLKSTGGRNNTGQMTVRYRGGGHKRMYRIIDFLRNKDGIAATVLTIEYDPNRSARIALVQYEDGEKRYIIAPNGLQVGQKIMSGSGISRIWATAFLFPRFLSVRSCTLSSSVPARVPPWHAALERSPSSPHVKASTQSSVSLRARPGWCSLHAAPPSVPYPTRTTTSSPSARPAVPAGSDAGLITEVW